MWKTEEMVQRRLNPTIQNATRHRRNEDLRRKVLSKSSSAKRADQAAALSRGSDTYSLPKMSLWVWLVTSKSNVYPTPPFIPFHFIEIQTVTTVSVSVRQASLLVHFSKNNSWAQGNSLAFRCARKTLRRSWTMWPLKMTSISMDTSPLLLHKRHTSLCYPNYVSVHSYHILAWILWSNFSIPAMVHRYSLPIPHSLLDVLEAT